MYVVVAKILKNKNENILAVVHDMDNAKAVITEHFYENYAKHLSLEIEKNIGYVVGHHYGNPDRVEAYVIVKPLR